VEMARKLLRSMEQDSSSGFGCKQELRCRRRKKLPRDIAQGS
jgi:hypothetical protein